MTPRTTARVRGRKTGSTRWLNCALRVSFPEEPKTGHLTHNRGSKWELGSETHCPLLTPTESPERIPKPITGRPRASVTLKL